MIFIIIGFIGATIYYKMYEGECFGELVLDWFIGILLGVACVLCFGLFCFLFDWFMSPMETTTVAEYELVQMGDQTYANTSGVFRGGLFLRSGTINTNLDAGYSYYQKEGNGFTLKTAGANNSTIKYTNDTPKVVITSSRCVNETSFGLWGFENICDHTKIATWNTFYIPEGSIAEGFELGDKK